VVNKAFRVLDYFMDNILLTPEEDVNRWLDRNGAGCDDIKLKSDVVLATPAAFNIFTNCARRWGASVEAVRVVWEPGAGADVVRAVNISSEGSSFSVFRVFSSASMAAGQLERLIAVGGKRFLFLGYADPLSPEASSGHLIAAVSAVRDEGVSGYYLHDNSCALASKDLFSLITHEADELGIAVTAAPVWTSEAVYRRSRSRVEELLGDGVAAVETVVSALYAVSKFRNVSTTALLVVNGNDAQAVDDGTQDACRIIMRLFLSQTL
jgi:hypothetical protein